MLAIPENDVGVGLPTTLKYATRAMSGGASARPISTLHESPWFGRGKWIECDHFLVQLR